MLQYFYFILRTNVNDWSDVYLWKYFFPYVLFSVPPYSLFIFASASLRSSLEKCGSFHCVRVCVSPVSHLLSGGGENGGLWLVLFGWAATNKSQCNIEAATEAMGQTGSPSCASERPWARLVRRLKHTPNSNPRKTRGKKREWRLKGERDKKWARKRGRLLFDIPH